MSRRVRLHRVGSDPEFSFIQLYNGEPTIYPAPELIGKNAGVRKHSFIGTDGHANTAELRPPPCHNIYWHLAKIADGLTQVKVGLDAYNAKYHSNILAVAQPALNEQETMGGHIWISMWYESELARKVINQLGQVYSVEQGGMIRSYQQLPEKYAFPRQDALIEEYRRAALAGDELSVDLAWLKLHYLIKPLEHWLFGDRRGMRRYVRDPHVRLPDKNNPNVPMRSGHAYFMFEYRYPTTQLAHPMIALGYFGLAKLAILNWNNLPGLGELGQAHVVNGAGRREWKETFRKRFDQLRGHPNFRTSRDLRDLPQIMDILFKTKIHYPTYIDFDEWKKFLTPPQEEMPG